MNDADTTGRPNQKRRTRQALLDAAARLVKQGRTPSLEEIAAEALVSRATAYRYFPSVEALVRESALDVATPAADELFRDGGPADPATRVERVDAALDAMIAANEAQLRLMLAHSMQQIVRGDDTLPARQNRRTPLIEAALAPARAEFDAAALRRLKCALALVIGTEGMIALKDVLQLDDTEARAVKRWMIRALVDAARRPTADGRGRHRAAAGARA